MSPLRPSNRNARLFCLVRLRLTAVSKAIFAKGGGCWRLGWLLLGAMAIAALLPWTAGLVMRHASSAEFTRSYVVRELRILFACLGLSRRTLSSLLRLLERAETAVGQLYIPICRMQDHHGMRQIWTFAKDLSRAQRPLLLPFECLQTWLERGSAWRQELLASGLVTRLGSHCRNVQDWRLALQARGRPLVDTWCKHIDLETLSNLEASLPFPDVFRLLGPFCTSWLLAHNKPTLIDRALDQLAQMAGRADDKEIAAIQFVQGLLVGGTCRDVAALPPLIYRRLEGLPQKSPAIVLLLALLADGRGQPEGEELQCYFGQAAEMFLSSPEHLIEILILALFLSATSRQVVKLDRKLAQIVSRGMSTVGLEQQQRLALAVLRSSSDYASGEQIAIACGMDLGQVLEAIRPKDWPPGLQGLVSKMPMAWRLAYYRRHHTAPYCDRPASLQGQDIYSLVTPCYHIAGVSEAQVRVRLLQELADPRYWLLLSKSERLTTFRPRVWIGGEWKRMLRLLVYLLVQYRRSPALLDHAFCQSLFKDGAGKKEVISADLQYATSHPDLFPVQGINRPVLNYNSARQAIRQLGDATRRIFTEMQLEMIVPQPDICVLLCLSP